MTPAPTGDIQRCPEICLFIIIAGVCAGEARDAVKCPIKHRTAPTTKTCPAQNVTSVDVEKLCVELKLVCNIKHIRGGAMQ